MGVGQLRCAHGRFDTPGQDCRGLGTQPARQPRPPARRETHLNPIGRPEGCPCKWWGRVEAGVILRRQRLRHPQSDAAPVSTRKQRPRRAHR